MLAASVVAARLTTSPPLLAASAIAGATVGFYGVLVVKVVREQRREVVEADEFGRREQVPVGQADPE